MEVSSPAQVDKNNAYLKGLFSELK